MNTPTRKISHALHLAQTIQGESRIIVIVDEARLDVWRVEFPMLGTPDSVITTFKWNLGEHRPPKITVEFGPVAAFCYEELGRNFWQTESDIISLLFSLKWDIEERYRGAVGRTFSQQDQEAYFNLIINHHQNWGYYEIYDPASITQRETCKLNLHRARFITENIARQPFYEARDDWAALEARFRTELENKLNAIGRDIHILILGLVGSGKSSFVNELATAVLGDWTPVEGTDNRDGSVTDTYRRRRLLTTRFIVNSLAGLVPENQSERHFSHVRHVLTGRLKNGTHMDDNSSFELVPKPPIDIVFLLVGPDDTNPTALFGLQRLKAAVQESEAQLVIVANKCDRTSEEDIAFNQLSLQECGPLRLIGTFDVYCRINIVAECLGINPTSVMKMMCPNAASTNQLCKDYFSLMILDKLVRTVERIQQNPIRAA